MKFVRKTGKRRLGMLLTAAFAMLTRTLSHGEVRRIFNAGRDGKALLSLLGN